MILSKSLCRSVLSVVMYHLELAVIDGKMHLFNRWRALERESIMNVMREKMTGASYDGGLFQLITLHGL